MNWTFQKLLLLVSLVIVLCFIYSYKLSEYIKTSTLESGFFPNCVVNNDANNSSKLRYIPFTKPFEYLKNYKNPCWIDISTNRIRCIPYFYISGFSKCGTTDLFRRIQHHPQVYASEVKETHYFDIHLYRGDDIFNYVKVFDASSEAISKQVDSSNFHNLIVGESTPMYIWYNSYWKVDIRNENCKEPRIVSGHFLKSLYPQAKTIIIMRNPTERAYSDYLFRYGYRKGRNVSNIEFHNLVKDAIFLYSNCFKEFTPRQCLYDITLRGKAKLLINIGIYYIYLKDWLSIFSTDQVYLVSFEDYKNMTRSELSKIFKYLGIGEPTESSWKDILHMDIQNAHNLYKDAGPMLQKTRQLLDSFYSTYNKLLYDFLKDKRFKY